MELYNTACTESGAHEVRMTPCLNLRLKEHLSVACSALKVDWSVFARQTGTRDFLIETRSVECPRELAVQALLRLPVDASANCVKVVSAAVVLFLDKDCGTSAGGVGFEQRVKDTYLAMHNKQDEAALRRLIDSWYS